MDSKPDDDKYNKDRIEAVLRLCEQKENPIHKQLSALLKDLWDVPGVNQDALTQIENLYIQKGILYCSNAYKMGFNDGEKAKKSSEFVNKLTGC